MDQEDFSGLNGFGNEEKTLFYKTRKSRIGGQNYITTTRFDKNNPYVTNGIFTIGDYSSSNDFYRRTK